MTTDASSKWFLEAMLAEFERGEAWLAEQARRYYSFYQDNTKSNRKKRRALAANRRKHGH